MLRKKYMMLGLMFVSVAVYGQKTERDYLRSGNKLYKDSTFVKAEVDYRKAPSLNRSLRMRCTIWEMLS